MVHAGNLFLVGMMGAGKTTVGRELSAQTGWPYVDNDDILRRQTGRDPAEIRATEGEDVLHLAESDAFDEALVVLDHAARRAPVAACSPGLLSQVVAARRDAEAVAR